MLFGNYRSVTVVISKNSIGLFKISTILLQWHPGKTVLSAYSDDYWWHVWFPRQLLMMYRLLEGLSQIVEEDFNYYHLWLCFKGPDNQGVRPRGWNGIGPYYSFMCCHISPQIRPIKQLPWQIMEDPVNPTTIHPLTPPLDLHTHSHVTLWNSHTHLIFYNIEDLHIFSLHPARIVTFPLWFLWPPLTCCPPPPPPHTHTFIVS